MKFAIEDPHRQMRQVRFDEITRLLQHPALPERDASRLRRERSILRQRLSSTGEYAAGRIDA